MGDCAACPAPVGAPASGAIVPLTARIRSVGPGPRIPIPGPRQRRHPAPAQPQVQVPGVAAEVPVEVVDDGGAGVHLERSHEAEDVEVEDVLDVDLIAAGDAGMLELVLLSPLVVPQEALVAHRPAAGAIVPVDGDVVAESAISSRRPEELAAVGVTLAHGGMDVERHLHPDLGEVRHATVHHLPAQRRERSAIMLPDLPCSQRKTKVVVGLEREVPQVPAVVVAGDLAPDLEAAPRENPAGEGRCQLVVWRGELVAPPTCPPPRRTFRKAS
jgi:hypothetical protein